MPETLGIYCFTSRREELVRDDRGFVKTPSSAALRPFFVHHALGRRSSVIERSLWKNQIYSPQPLPLVCLLVHQETLRAETPICMKPFSQTVVAVQLKPFSTGIEGASCRCRTTAFMSIKAVLVLFWDHILGRSSPPESSDEIR
jgi:hypothetical protein